MYKNKKNADVTTVNSFKQYVGEYVLEEAGMTIKIYTKKNDTQLFLFASGQPEYELVATQPDGTYTTIRNGKMEIDDLEHKLVVHGGASNLFATDLWIYPKKGITIVVLSNKFEEYVYSIARRFSNFLLAK